MRLPCLRFTSALCCLIVGFGGLSALALDDTDSLKCDNGIVQVGDSKFDVQSKCGEPSALEEGGDVWIYDFGSTEFLYYLTFKHDIVEWIQVGERGK